MPTVSCRNGLPDARVAFEDRGVLARSQDNGMRGSSTLPHEACWHWAAEGPLGLTKCCP